MFSPQYLSTMMRINYGLLANLKKMVMRILTTSTNYKAILALAVTSPIH
jgi:hypothetical protein